MSSDAILTVASPPLRARLFAHLQELEPDAVEALAAAAGSLLEDEAPRQALAALSEAAARAVGADLVIARTASASGEELVARAVHARPRPWQPSSKA